MKKIIGIILILASICLGYLGIVKLNDSGESIDILGAELSVEDNQKKSTSFILLGFSIVSFIGGIYLVSRRSN